jgi:hypothetical protein
VAPTAQRTISLQEAIVLETSGPPPSDTSVTFRTGEPRIIVLRHGPPENVAFVQLAFPPEAFGPARGREVRVEVRPRPGIYGVDVATTLPIQSGASLLFTYARYFLAPAQARTVYGNEVLFERALAVGQVQPGGLLTLLPASRPAADVLAAPLPAAGRYLVAAPR